LAEFREDDVSVAIRKIAFREREQGETAFPDLGTIVNEVRTVRNRRSLEEQLQASREEDARRAEDRRLHPERYFGMAELLKEYNERRQAERGDA
jgi:hypothetical protein